MNGCEYFEKLIDRLLETGLSPEEEAALDEHVRACPDCAARMDACLAIREIMASDLAEPPAELAEGVMDRIHAENAAQNVVPIARAKKRPLLGRWAAAACLAVVIGSGAWMAMKSGVLRYDRAAAPTPVSAAYTAGDTAAENDKNGQAPAPQPESDSAPAGGQPDVADAAAPEEEAAGQEPAVTQEAPPQPREAAEAPAEDGYIEAGETVTTALGDAPAEAAAMPAPEEPPMPLPERPPEPMPEAAMAAEMAEDAAIEAADEIATARAEFASASDIALALAVYGPDGEYLGCITDTAALDDLLAENDPVPGNLAGIQWDVICSVTYGGCEYTFAADGDDAHLVWWTDAEPALALSPGAPEDLRGLIQ